MYRYDQKKDYCYDFKNPKSLDISNAVSLKEYNNQTLILKLDIKSTFLSRIFSPYIKVTLEEKTEKTFFEHGARGFRYLDISSFAGFDNVKISTKYCRIVLNIVQIFSFENLDIKNKKVLIIAPHADDAEISSFGLYGDAKESFIVTVTAGEGNCSYCCIEQDKEKQSLLKGNLRVFDALTIGQLAKVAYENNIVLGYFNETIKKMYEDKNNIISSKTAGISDVNYFRRVSHSKIKTNPKASSKWDSLVIDFKYIVESISPDLILTLHPQIDSNVDHKYITLALVEALDELNCEDIKLLTFTNHLIQNEIYPYGEIFSTISLVPSFDKPFVFDKIYSHKLTKEQQIYKYYALEAMHDLRDSMIQIGFFKSLKFTFKQLRRIINGKEKSYYRRSVRTNEIFYITNYKELKKVYEKDFKHKFNEGF
jgi:LmbE family N-acetylglucosaminyl deacetylase